MSPQATYKGESISSSLPEGVPAGACPALIVYPSFDLQETPACSFYVVNDSNGYKLVAAYEHDGESSFNKRKVLIPRPGSKAKLKELRLSVWDTTPGDGWLGKAKQYSSLKLPDHKGRLWAEGAKIIRTCEIQHARNAFKYIRDHAIKEGAWIWRYDKDPMPEKPK